MEVLTIASRYCSEEHPNGHCAGCGLPWLTDPKGNLRFDLDAHKFHCACANYQWPFTSPCANFRQDLPDLAWKLPV